jgi:hypothetical protein
VDKALREFNMRYFRSEIRPSDERRAGTVLVMFTVCLTAIMGLMALVIDGGLIRAEQIRVQAVADAAALAGARQLYQQYSTDHGKDTSGDAGKDALTIAAENGYSNDGTNSTVQVNIPPTSGQYAGVAGYIEILITSRLDRCFSNVWSSVSVCVRARSVARGAWVPFSASILLLDLGDKGAVSVKSGGLLTSTGAPAYVNSNSASALSVSGGGTFAVPAMNITGSYSGSGVTGTITIGVHPTPDPLAYLPAPGEVGGPSLPTAGAVVKTSLGDSKYQYDLYPGTFDSLPGFNNGDKLVFHQASSNANGGIYYLTGSGLKSQGARVAMANSESGGVMIYLAGTGSGNMFNLAGGSDSSVSLRARTDGPYSGLLLFQSRSLSGDLIIAGNGVFDLSGTIYAPAARLYVTGNGATSSIGSQWIGRNLFLTGAGGINIAYTGATVARTRIVAVME